MHRKGKWLCGNTSFLRKCQFMEMVIDGKGAFLVLTEFKHLRWAGFPIKIGRNAHREHLFSIYFDDFSTICMIFLV